MTVTLKTPSITKALPFLFALALVLLWAAPVEAQHQHQQADSTKGMMQGMMKQGDMKQGGMMQGMMQGDMMQQHMQMMNDPMHRPAMLVHMLPTMQEPLALSDDQLARMNQHAQKFNVEMEALVNATAAQMEGVLSAEQRTKLSEMEPMQMHQHMMANMNMMGMMHSMHGNMMQDGLMQGGMMQDGLMNKNNR